LSKEEDEEHQRFSDWLASRMVDANLNPEDRKVFTDWLMKESPDDSNVHVAHHAVARETKNELFTWLKTRITTSDINDRERKLFNEWLVQRVTDHPSDDHAQYHKLKRELLD
jgi:alkylhydroperoxidase family enzyme